MGHNGVFRKSEEISRRIVSVPIVCSLALLAAVGCVSSGEKEVDWDSACGGVLRPGTATKQNGQDFKDDVIRSDDNTLVLDQQSSENSERAREPGEAGKVLAGNISSEVKVCHLHTSDDLSHMKAVFSWAKGHKIEGSEGRKIKDGKNFLGLGDDMEMYNPRSDSSVVEFYVRCESGGGQKILHGSLEDKLFAVGLEDKELLLIRIAKKVFDSLKSCSNTLTFPSKMAQ